MRVLLTRPEREAAHWLRELAGRGLQAEALPLMAIGPVSDTAELLRAWDALAGYAAVMFVSGNAAHYFFEAKPAAARIWSGPDAIKTRAWAPGPATAAALAAHGVAPGLIDAPAADAPQFDSEALWQQVQGLVRAGDRVLVVRGAGEDGQGAGRDWLAAQLAGEGVVVETVTAYVRRPPGLDAAQLERARSAAQDGSAWLFSSSQAIAHLAQLLPGQDWSRARAVVTHPRIAQAAQQAGFGVVCQSRPTVEAIAAALESIR